MKKLLTIIVLSLSFFCKAQSQNADLYKIYLKSGLIIKAELVKIIPDSIIKIKQYGMFSTLNFDLIDSVVFSESRLSEFQQAFHKVRPPVRNLLDTSWSWGIQPGFTIGKYYWDLTSSFVLRASVLKDNGRHLMYGFNFGLEPYSYFGQLIGAADLEGRYYFRANSNRSAFLNLINGYGFNLVSNDMLAQGGFNSFTGLGQSFRTRNNIVFSFVLGYKFQRFKSYGNFWTAAPVYTYNNMNRLEFKFEWRF